MSDEQILSFIGLAQKARKLVSGEFSVEKSVRSGQVVLIILAIDASQNTKKNFHDMARFYQLPIREAFTKEQLGEAIGKPYRATLGIQDKGFGEKLVKMLQE